MNNREHDRTTREIAKVLREYGKTIETLTVENAKLKAELALMRRKDLHKCNDIFCKECGG